MKSDDELRKVACFGVYDESTLEPVLPRVEERDETDPG